METLFWLIATLGTTLTVTYRRVDLKTSTAAFGTILVAYTALADAGPFWLLLLWLAFACLAVLIVDSLRRDHITARLLEIFRTMLPTLSATERSALEAGSVWWEGQLFSGMPDWHMLTDMPRAKVNGRGTGLSRRPDGGTLRAAG